MRGLRQSASGRRLWRSPRLLFVAFLILAVAVVSSVAAAAPGQPQAGKKPAAWTWGPKAPGSTVPASSSSVSPARSGPTGKTLTGATGDHVVIGQSSKNDTSPALRNITPVPFSATKHKPIPVLPLGTQVTNPKRVVNKAAAAHVQTKLAAPKMPDPLLNFEGIDFPGVNCGCAPPDPNGAVGDTQYVQIVNTALEVFDKSNGNSLLGPISIESIWSGFGGVCENNGEGDPIVLYDKLANRWLISQLAGTAQPDNECVAVSTSDDATGSWNRYDFNLGSIFGENFYDYPKLGTWPDAYYLSYNVFNAAGTAFLGPQPFALDRSAMLAGNPATVVSPGMLGPTDDQLMPADFDGSILPPAGAPNPFTEIGTNPTWKLWRFHVDFTNPSNSTFTLAGTLTPDPFNVVCGGAAGPCVPQAGVPDQLDTLGDRSMFRNDYRRFANGDEALVGNMTVDPGNGTAGIRWYQLDNATSGSPSFVQQSTYAPDDTYRWMGSAAMDASGDIAVGFSASSSSINPQIRYAGRLASDPLNTLSQGEATLFSGTGSQTDTNSRWGDYSDLTVDPSDDCTFWYTNEYYTTTSSFNWHTRIGSFKFPSCTTGPSGTLSGTVTNAGDSSPIAGATVDVSQGGQSFGSTTTDGSGHYSIDLPVGTYDVAVSAFGFASSDNPGVQITDGNTTTLDVALQPAPAVTVSGTVTDGSGHGWPLYARIDVAGDPASPFFTDPITGHYSFQVPGNASYDVTYTSKVQGYEPDEETLVVGGSDLTHDVQLTATPDCTAPGYKQDTSLSESFDESNDFPPAGWTVDDNLNNGEVWQLNDPEGQQNTTGGTGNFADINSDFYGPSGQQDTSLVTPTLDLSSATAPYLTFHNDYFAGDPFPQTGDVDVSTDGGSTWTNVWHHGTDAVPGPDLETVQLPQAAGQSNVKVRFHFTSQFGFWWQIDDVTVHNSSGCITIPGGLVEGNVSDLTTGNPINGAKVQSDDAPGDSAKTGPVPDDPNNPGGFYVLFSTLTGSHNFTASASLHSSVTKTVDVQGDSVVRQDFQLGSGHLTITPTTLHGIVTLGGTQTTQLTFHNDGTGPANVTLNEASGGFQILHAQGAPLARIKTPDDDQGGGPDPGWLGDHKNANAPRVNAGPPKDPSWSTIAGYPTGIMDNGCDFISGKEYCVGGVDASLAITNKGNVYDPGSDTWTPIADMANAREKPGVASVNGKLYVTGGWDTTGTPIATTEVYDPGSDSWSSVAPNPSPTAAPGVAVANGKIYFIGGCADGSCTTSSKVEVYDPASDTWSSAADYPTGTSWIGCGGINGKVYCAGGINGSTTTTSGNVYDPGSDTWSPIADMPLDLWGSVAGPADGQLLVSGGVTADSTVVTNQGVEYDPASDSWSAAPNAQFPRYRAGGGCGFYKVGGSSGGFSPTPDSEALGPGLDQCGTTDVPWLSENPTQFTVPVGGTKTVTVKFTATTAKGVTQPGTYTANLLVNADTPQSINPIPVTLDVAPPANWGKLQGTINGKDCSGTTAALGTATVFADNGSGFKWIAPTDKNGLYSFWGPASQFTLIVVANKWFPQTKTALIKAAKTTTVNFTLRPAPPC
jgi:Carboxypeptidase regulatory-like domain/Kelch motif